MTKIPHWPQSGTVSSGAADYLASLGPKPVATASGDQARPKWEPCMEYDPADVPSHLRRWHMDNL